VPHGVTRYVGRSLAEEFVKELFLACGLVVALTRPVAAAQSDSTVAQQHAFDFEFGAWKAHISRLKAPLTASKEWVEYDGTSVVRRVWDGKANLGELDVSGPAGRIQGLSCGPTIPSPANGISPGPTASRARWVRR
jgi:hypothetical protein